MATYASLTDYLDDIRYFLERGNKDRYLDHAEREFDRARVLLENCIREIKLRKAADNELKS